MIAAFFTHTGDAMHSRIIIGLSIAAVAMCGYDGMRQCPPNSVTGEELESHAPPTDEAEDIDFGQRTHYLLHYRLGQFDPNGNFVPYEFANWVVYGLGAGPLKVQTISHSDGSLAYEHRSGRLIRGSFVKTAFVPEIGSTVIDLKKDFDPNKTDRVIYNLPSHMFCVPVVRGPEPPKAERPAKWDLVPFRDAFPGTPNRNPFFARVIGDKMEIGNLRDNGEFKPEYSIPLLPYVKLKYPKVLHDGSNRTLYLNLPLHNDPVRVPPDGSE